jgi:hypothetical protein
MKIQKIKKPLKPTSWKNESSKPKGKSGKIRTGKQGSIRSGGGKRK